MRKIRIGNDIAVQWSLVAKGTGEPFVVEGKDIRLSLKSIFSTTEIEDFTAQGNKIAWTFKGAEQKQTGIYSLVVSVVDAQGAMVTTDVCQFVELVACSCEADGADEAGVHTESIDLVSNVEIGVGSSYDDTELRDIIADLDNQVSARREEIMNLEYSKADKSELTELSAEVGKKQDTITDLATIRSGAEKGATAIQEVKTINGQSIVGSGNIDIQGGGGASNEWKCIADRRLLEGEKNIIFTTYADGTPLKAKEVMVQILCDKKAAQNITGYVGIKSTNNQNEAIYGSLMYEDTTIAEGAQVLSQIYLEASPFFMVAEMNEGVKCTVASPTNPRVQGGNLKTFQIYEDIVYVRISSNVALTSTAPYLKVYAR